MTELEWLDGPPPSAGLYYLLNLEARWAWTETLSEKDLKGERLASLKYAGPLAAMPPIPEGEMRRFHFPF